MALSNYGELKAAAGTYLFHQRFAPQYDTAQLFFEAVANRRLRVREMESSALLTTVDGEVALPDDYLAWRTVLPTDERNPQYELEYVHPAYLPPTSLNRRYPKLFTIEGNLFKVRPINDVPSDYEMHYYGKVPSLVGNDTNSNWLLLAYPDFALEGLLVELFVLGRSLEMAQLHKQRRDELLEEIKQLSALTTGATSQSVRTGEYY